MRFRKLRIAFSAACGIACLLLILLWVRSYWQWDEVYYPAGEISSISGHISYFKFGGSDFDWGFNSYPRYDESPLPPDTVLGFRWLTGDDLGILDAFKIYVPYWFPVSVSAVFVAAPWVGWSKRFSLRTLLMATTLVAVLLGLIVWLSHR